MLTDPVTGQVSQSEYFAGNVKMGEKEEQMYLGDLLSSNGKHAKNISHRKGKGLGVINDIIQILQSTYLGNIFRSCPGIERKSSPLLSALKL